MNTLKWTATAAGAALVAAAGALLTNVAPLYFFAWLAASVVTP